MEEELVEFKMEIDESNLKELTKQDIFLLNKLNGLKQMHQAKFVKTEGHQFYDASNIE